LQLLVCIGVRRIWGHGTQCWIWLRGTSKGRPVIYVGGRNRNAHRVAWEQIHDEHLQSGMILMRQCQQSLCVNPDHHRKSLRELGLRRFTSPEEYRRWNLRKYGLTPEDYDRMLEAQDGLCAVCRTNDLDRLGRRMHVDHCHNTGRVRGILCTRCNNAIGFAGESAQRLRDLATYLEEGSRFPLQP